MKILLIIPIIWVLQNWINLVIPEKWQCRKCWSFWLSIPLIIVPQHWLELAVIPALISLIYYIIDKYTTFNENNFKL